MKNGWTETLAEKDKEIAALKADIRGWLVNWKGWLEEREKLKAEVEQLRKAVQAVIDDGYPFEILVAAINKKGGTK